MKFAGQNFGPDGDDKKRKLAENNTNTNSDVNVDGSNQSAKDFKSDASEKLSDTFSDIKSKLNPVEGAKNLAKDSFGIKRSSKDTGEDESKDNKNPEDDDGGLLDARTDDEKKNDDSNDGDKDINAIGNKATSGLRQSGEKVISAGAANADKLLVGYGAYKAASGLSKLISGAVHLANRVWDVATTFPVLGPAVKMLGNGVGYLLKGSGTYLWNGAKGAWGAIKSGAILKHPFATMWGGAKYAFNGLWGGVERGLGAVPKLAHWAITGQGLRVVGQTAAGVPKLLSGIWSGLNFLAGKLLSNLGPLLAMGAKLGKALGAMLLNGLKAVLQASAVIGKTVLGSLGVTATNVISTTVGASLMLAPLSAIGYTGYELLRDRNISYPGLCSTQNSSNALSPSADVESGVGGEWTKKGTKEYSIAKDLWDASIKHGFNGVQAAGILGNAYTESAGFHKLDQDQIGGGGGKGLFQFTGATLTAVKATKSWDNSWSADNQLLSFIEVEKHTGFPQFLSTTKGSDDIENSISAWLKYMERAGVPNLESRLSAGKEAYSLFHGESEKGDESKLQAMVDGNTSAIAMLNSATASALNNLNCRNGGNLGAADGNILSIAKALEGYFTYENSRPVLPHVSKNGKLDSIDDVNRNGDTDCSGYVWLVLKLAGYKVPEGGWFTMSMANDAQGPKQYLKEIPISEAKAGDIVIANLKGTGGSGSNGHTAILAADPKGISDGDGLLNSSTPIWNEGGGSDSVSKSKMNYSFYGWAGAADCIVARPVSKAKD
ncbi:phage tail tip lysozyme [Ligilactobacillus equi]|uniref:Phage tail lysozyme domain-containing protein n=1 Tax=Ligilactobacillus equi DSM 15833 = JCM 10991 TaxID=1423740 RepID=A0A0R1TU52_9LACO|nr:phage tail tip lysozyme [Ligilactobacillus equi]KRL84366.1 hypothetical protein FC36_GL000289 [Ligilactobacillus equi DSM 15833 = JCM 10991]